MDGWGGKASPSLPPLPSFFTHIHDVDRLVHAQAVHDLHEHRDDILPLVGIVVVEEDTVRGGAGPVARLGGRQRGLQGGALGDAAAHAAGRARRGDSAGDAGAEARGDACRGRVRGVREAGLATALPRPARRTACQAPARQSGARPRAGGSRRARVFVSFLSHAQPQQALLLPGRPAGGVS